MVASNIGVVPELVSDKQTGLLFEAGNALDLPEGKMAVEPYH